MSNVVTLPAARRMVTVVLSRFMNSPSKLRVPSALCHWRALAVVTVRASERRMQGSLNKMVEVVRLKRQCLLNLSLLRGFSVSRLGQCW